MDPERARRAVELSVRRASEPALGVADDETPGLGVSGESSPPVDGWS